jgi:DNA-binding NarL/FixJ family response regulator
VTIDSVRLVVVDDQPLVRTGLAALLDLENGIEVIGQAADGAEGVAVCRELRPDVVLMDIRMPVLDGIAATEQIVRDGLGTRVIVLTTFHLDELVHGAIRAGASGFLLKDCSPEELAHAVRVVAGGEALLSPAVTRRLLHHFARADQSPARLTRVATARALVERLTGREREVLRLIARGLSNQEIAATTFVAASTVKTHISRVFLKLEVRDRAQAVVLAFDAGIVLPGASSDE